jgi:hypothetical protein
MKVAQSHIMRHKTANGEYTQEKYSVAPAVFILAILLKSICCGKNITNSSGKTYPASMLRTRAIKRKMEKLGTGCHRKKKVKKRKKEKKKGRK